MGVCELGGDDGSMTIRTLGARDRRAGRCPKRMVFGPCGGVRDGGGCELDAALPCPWADQDDPAPVAAWPYPRPPQTPPGPGSLLARARQAPVVLTDLSVPAFDLAALRAVAAIIAGESDAVLCGDVQHRPDFPPAMIAAELQASGTHPWITLSCRDRNRTVLEQELRGLAALGVEGVLCVTGDLRGPGVQSEATQVFDLDATRLAHLATTAGLTATVAVTPAAPPREARAGVLAEKQRAGAQLAVSNHVASAAVLEEFLRDARRYGADLPVLGAVAVYTDEASAALLTAFPGLALDPSRVAAVLEAPDPVAAGIDAAVLEARELLAVPGVVGVNLSGSASATSYTDAAEIQAAIARRVHALAR